MPVCLQLDGLRPEALRQLVAPRNAPPLLADLQVNGLWLPNATTPRLVDFSARDLRLEDVEEAAKELHRQGIAFWVPTIITAPGEVYERNLPILAEAMRQPWGKGILGVHLEGPFLAKSCKGAHPEDCIQAPSIAAFERWQQLAEGNIVWTTVSPTYVNTPEFIRAVRAKCGAVVSLGHHDATAGQIHAAIEAGATGLTHAGNTWNREAAARKYADILTMVASRPEVWRMLITDGEHVPLEFAELVHRTAQQAANGGAPSLILVSDESPLGGAPAGKYRVFQTLNVEVGPSAVTPHNVSRPLSGSMLNLAQCVDIARSWGIMPEETVRLAASLNPIRFLRPALLERGWRPCPEHVEEAREIAAARETAREPGEVKGGAPSTFAGFTLPSIAAPSVLSARPAFRANYAPGFTPMSVVLREFGRAVQASSNPGRVLLGLERENGLTCRWTVPILPENAGRNAENLAVVDNTLKYLLWSRGGSKVQIAGPDSVVKPLQSAYSPTGVRKADIAFMRRAYPLADGDADTFLIPAKEEDIPASREAAKQLGGHTDGVRIGFDLGASDIKIAIMVDGRVVFSHEYPWNTSDPDWLPTAETDPRVHRRLIQEKIDLAYKYMAEHYPGRAVEAVGGSSAGIIVDNRIMVASLFKSVSEEDFRAHARNLFVDLARHYNVPFEVLNDGDVTALAGAQSLGVKKVLGLAGGSSVACGYVDGDGAIRGWLNEGAFFPFDLSPGAFYDPWAKDPGRASRYLSQQLLEGVLERAGIQLPNDMTLPDKLKEVQRRVEIGDVAARRIFEDAGTFLGYMVPQHDRFYDLETVLALGRMMSGAGGDLIVNRAQHVLRAEFPEVAERVRIVTPTDDKLRRVAQAAAAATLPRIVRD